MISYSLTQPTNQSDPDQKEEQSTYGRRLIQKDSRQHSPYIVRGFSAPPSAQ